MLNKTTVVGRLAHDPELKGTQEESVCVFVIAAGNRGKNTQFIRAKCFGVTATQVFNYCRKGRLVICEGHLESKNNQLEFIGDSIQFGPDAYKPEVTEI